MRLTLTTYSDKSGQHGEQQLKGQEISTYFAYTVCTAPEALRRNCEIIWAQASADKAPGVPTNCHAEERAHDQVPIQTCNIQYVPVLSCNASNRSPRSATFVMFSLIIPTVSSIW